MRSKEPSLPRALPWHVAAGGNSAVAWASNGERSAASRAERAGGARLPPLAAPPKEEVPALDRLALVWVDSRLLLAELRLRLPACHSLPLVAESKWRRGHLASGVHPNWLLPAESKPCRMSMLLVALAAGMGAGSGLGMLGLAAAAARGLEKLARPSKRRACLPRRAYTPSTPSRTAPARADRVTISPRCHRAYKGGRRREECSWERSRAGIPAGCQLASS